MSKVSDKLAQHSASRANDIDHFLSELNVSMAASKDLINSAYKKLTTRPISNAEWARIEKQARSRPLPDCAICLTPMHMGYTAIPGACDTGRASASPCPGH